MKLINYFITYRLGGTRIKLFVKQCKVDFFLFYCSHACPFNRFSLMTEFSLFTLALNPAPRYRINIREFVESI